MLLPKWMFSVCSYTVIIIASMCFFTLVDVAEARDWPEHKSRIIKKRLKIESAENKIKDLIDRKKRQSNAAAAKLIIKEMVTAHAELQALIKKREKELNHMRFRHPEKGEEFDDKYFKTYKLKSVEELEDEMGLSGQLNKIRRIIEKHYGLKSKDEKEKFKNKKNDKTVDENKIKIVR